jgi:hypothetical protein
MPGRTEGELQPIQILVPAGMIKMMIGDKGRRKVPVKALGMRRLGVTRRSSNMLYTPDKTHTAKIARGKLARIIRNQIFWNPKGSKNEI